MWRPPLIARGGRGARTDATLVRARTAPPGRGRHPIRVMTGLGRPATIGGMPVRPDSRFQTVPIRKGRHDSPARGACVMELSSMLAGERFDDHPRSVCPVIAAFLRGYNDLLPDGQHDELYPYAALVVGTAGRRAIRRQRARRILELDGGDRRRRSFRPRLQSWDLVLLPAVEAALRMDPEQRRVVVGALIDELCAMGRPADVAAPETPRSARGVAPGADTRSATPSLR